jgi:hypothetical protein
MGRRWELGLVPLLSRLGIERPDQTPAQVEGDARLVAAVADLRFSAQHPGSRIVDLWVSVPAVAGQYSCAYITPPEEGAYIIGLENKWNVGTITAIAWGTENQASVPFPTLTGVGGQLSFLTSRFDSREPAPTLLRQLGSDAGGPDSWAFSQSTSVAFGGAWWTGTRLAVLRQTVNTPLEFLLRLAVPLIGARR